MITKKCRCGKTEKAFKVDIGPFFVDSCCLEAGYDDLGNKVKKDLNIKDLTSQEEIEKEAAKLQEDPAEEQAKILDQVEETDLSEEQKEQIAEQEETEDEKKERLAKEDKAAKKAAKDAEKAAKKAAKEAEKKAKAEQK